MTSQQLKTLDKALLCHSQSSTMLQVTLQATGDIITAFVFAREPTTASGPLPSTCYIYSDVSVDNVDTLSLNRHRPQLPPHAAIPQTSEIGIHWTDTTKQALHSYRSSLHFVTGGGVM